MWTRHDFFYELPDELIAQTPLAERSASRLLVVENDSADLTLSDCTFPDLLEFLKPDDHIVFNNTKVIPARIHGQKTTGGRVELLLERCLSKTEALVHIKASKAPKPGAQLYFDAECVVTVLAKKDNVYQVKFDRSIVPYLEVHGHMPLPPYIEREDTEDDQTRYQTVFAKELGAVAAPTASLHFDDELLSQIRAKGIGTTVVRSLETASQSGQLEAFSGESQLFIYPGYEFKTVDAMVTNFHLSESTLLMLVSAFVGYDEVKQAYQHAIKERYRFFSYGDAMLLLPSTLK